ncbi:hypothetical protein YSY43_38110 [Paenibacillus sp. YSY-4.3]
MLAKAMLGGELSSVGLILFAQTAKDSIKAACMEALEYATKQDPQAADRALFEFARDNLDAKAPRLKWESAKVIGNIASLYREDLEPAVARLLENAKDEGTVVRWSAAYALTEIYSLPGYSNDNFRDKLAAICATEEKASIKKIYGKCLSPPSF